MKRWLWFLRSALASMASVGPPAAALAAFVVASAGAVEPATPHRPRNLLLISLDALRQDRLGTYGYARPTTPNIDRLLAARGAVFERAYTAAPETPDAHMTALTSLLPCAHGVNGIARRPLAAGIPTLAEILRASGYATAAFTEDGWVTRALGFGRGFDRFVEERSPVLSAPVGAAQGTFAAAARWIREEAMSPWFAFVHTYQVHHPYTPPRPDLDALGIRGPPSASDRYDGEIRYTDRLLPDLLDAADGDPASPCTLVVLFSDHGEQFGEHGLTLHANSLYEELLRVPLIVRAPCAIQPGIRVRETVGLIDLLPTVLELLEVAAPAGLQGRSLAPLLLPARPSNAPSADGPALYFAELPIPGAERVAAIRGTEKSILDPERGSRVLFDLSRDPHERDGQERGPSDRETTHLLRRYRHLCAARHLEKGASPPLPEAVREKLRALGYLAEEAGASPGSAAGSGRERSP